MSRLTDRLYWQWRQRNGAVKGDQIPDYWGGIGGMPPMKAQQQPCIAVPRVRSSEPVQVVAARPEKLD